MRSFRIADHCGQARDGTRQSTSEYLACQPCRTSMGSVETALLAVFQEVARQGSFTGAARSLGYTQSAVSRQISTLEQEIGAGLFDRLPRGVRLTDEGRCLLPHAEAVTGRLGSALDDLRALRDLSAG